MICIHHILFRDQIMKMEWEGHLARLGKRETHARFWWGNLKGGPCSTYGGEESCIQGFGGGKT